MKPMIGVLPFQFIDTKFYQPLTSYTKSIEAAGGIPVLLPLTNDDSILDEWVERMDGFLFPGGYDVTPSIYGTPKCLQCGDCNTELDEIQLQLFHKIYEKDKPLFGICRGTQFINAALGGTLYQDLPTQRPTATVHKQEPPYDVDCHKVDILEAQPLSHVVGKTCINVNSLHHQAIKDVAPSLTVMAYAEDGVVEAVYDSSRSFLWGVQWHPEFTYQSDEESRRLFHYFVQQCKARISD